MRIEINVQIHPWDRALWQIWFDVGGEDGPPPRTAQRLGAAPWIGPIDPPDELEELCADGFRQAITLARLVHEGGEIETGDPRRFGSFLFHALLGRETWESLRGLAPPGSSVLELAISCDVEARAVQGVAWELMHDGDEFLAIDTEPPVAVTRVVGSSTAPKPIASPPRVLFMLGAPLTDPGIRAGAEFMGLLGQVEHDGGAIHPYVLESAGLERLQQTMRRFRPDVVHIIAHGRLGRHDEPLLEVRPDDDTSRVARHVTAEQLLAALRTDGGLPTVVVLSACSTAVTGLVGGTHATSLAAELVSHGIPIVVAMSGRVTDLACRLFTRRFGQVLIRGGPLVAAVTHARRAAYVGGQTPTGTVDWALPAIFLSDAVPEHHSLIAPPEGNGRSAARLIRDSGLAGEPVFCGRRQFFDAYERLMDPDDPSRVLVIHTAQRRGMGEKRLLKELGAHALRDGNIPLLVQPGRVRAPRTTWELAYVVLDAIRSTRRNLGLPELADSWLLKALMLPVRFTPPTDPEVGRFEIAAIIDDLSAGDRQLSHQLFKMAAGRDIAQLVEDAREHLSITHAGSAALVLLEGVEWWDGALHDLFLGMLDQHGFGDSPTTGVAVALTCATGSIAAETLDSQREAATSKLWLRFMELKPLQPDGEDALAFEWVLLHPRQGMQMEESECVYAVVNREGRWLTALRKQTQNGVPGRMNDVGFYIVADAWAENGELCRGDDEARLRAYLERQG